MPFVPPADDSAPLGWREALLVVGAALVATAVMAWPVLSAPAERLFGTETVGRHPDPFILMQQYAAGGVPSPYVQPATDLPAVLVARVAGGAVAVNTVVLATFPLAALAMYLLARYLTGSRLASAVAAAAFAWSPFHVAHAGYHPHIAQVQWWPLYLLALCVIVRRPSALTVALAAGAGLLLAMSSFYWAVFAALLTPVAVIAMYVVPPAAARPAPRHVLLVLGGALAVTVAAIGAANAVAAEVFREDRFAFPPADLAHYTARWFSYLAPPIEHPVLGRWAAELWVREGNAAGALEQQVMSGWALTLLGVVAVWLRVRHGSTRLTRAVPWLVVVAGAAWLMSTGPEWQAAGWRVTAPAGLIYRVAPMFRSYARLGVVVTLAVAALAGIGARGLWPSRAGRVAVVALLLFAAFELRPLAARWRDVLPSPAYRHLASGGGEWRVLDCTPPGRTYALSIRVLLGSRAAFREPPFDDCAEPSIGPRLAALGFTSMIVRRGSAEGRWLDEGGSLSGLRRTAEWVDEFLLSVDTLPAPVYITAIEGFHLREFEGRASWRWMPAEASWIIMNPGRAAIEARLEVQASALDGPRTLEMWMSSERVAAAAIASPARYTLGPVSIPAGETRVRFRIREGDAPADAVLRNGDPRRLGIRFDDWQWTAVARGAR